MAQHLRPRHSSHSIIDAECEAKAACTDQDSPVQTRICDEDLCLARLMHICAADAQLVGEDASDVALRAKASRQTCDEHWITRRLGKVIVKLQSSFRKSVFASKPRRARTY